MRSPWSSSGPVAFFVSLRSYQHHHHCQHRSAYTIYDSAVPIIPPHQLTCQQQRHSTTKTSPTTSSLALIDNRRTTTTTTTTTDCLLPHDDVIARYELDDPFSRWRFLQKLLEGDIPPIDVEDCLLLTLSAYLQHGPTSGSSSSNSSSSSLDEKQEKDTNGGNASPVLTPSQRIIMADIIKSIRLFTSSSSSKDNESDVNNNDRRFISMLLQAPNGVENDVNAALFDYYESNEEEEVEYDDGVVLEEIIVVDESAALTLLERIEKNLLPDPIDDEDAYKGTWDVIIELYGRESVRVSEDRMSREGKEEEIEGELVIQQTSSRLRRKNLQWRTLSSIGRVLIHFDLLTKGVLSEGAFLASSFISKKEDPPTEMC